MLVVSPFRGTSIVFCTAVAFSVCVASNSLGVFLFLHILANACCFLCYCILAGHFLTLSILLGSL